ncbi:MAG: glycosyltransferase family 2 protein [Planctomycetes bacterium]|nr:glycosyltransferase family 2 protein [Planctomycetota bacterium]
MPRVTACVLTKNEEKHLPACLESLRWADALQVLDSGSTDRTLEIARRFGAQILQRPWTGFYDQRVHQFAMVETEWLFWLDADERCTPQLAQEIRDLLKSEPARAGYTVPRLTYFLDAPIRRCGWFPDRMPRLFRKDSWSFNRPGIHAKIEIRGGSGELRGLIEHYPYDSLAVYYRKMASYAVETADYKFAQGKRCSLAGALAIGPARFLKTYLLQRGFLDGRAGLVVSWLSAVSDSMKYLELYDRTRRERAARRTAL